MSKALIMGAKKYKLCNNKDACIVLFYLLRCVVQTNFTLVHPKIKPRGFIIMSNANGYPTWTRDHFHLKVSQGRIELCLCHKDSKGVDPMLVPESTIFFIKNSLFDNYFNHVFIIMKHLKQNTKFVCMV